jgi:hypothetical protein
MTTPADVAYMYQDLLASGLSTGMVTVTTAGAVKTVPAIIRYGKGDKYKGADGFGVVATLRIQAQGDQGVELITKKTEITIGAGIWRVIDADKSASGLEWIVQVNKVTS